MQLVTDSNQRVRDCVARWPGSTHDSRILRNSSLFEEFEEGGARGYILGDSGYPCKPWLLTPMLRPVTAQEEAYNRLENFIVSHFCAVVANRTANLTNRSNLVFQKTQYIINMVIIV